MRAQQTKARMAVRGCRRPCRLRGSGTSARKESRLTPRDASMRCLRAIVQRESRLPSPQVLLLFSQGETVKGPGPPVGRLSRGMAEVSGAGRVDVDFRVDEVDRCP